MKILVYRLYGESVLYTLTLKYFKLTRNYDFENDKDMNEFTIALEEGFPFKIVECTELEFDTFKQFLESYDAFGINEVSIDRIMVKVYQFDRNYMMTYEDAARECYRDIKELEEKLESLQYDMKLYDGIYHKKYGAHIFDEYDD